MSEISARYRTLAELFTAKVAGAPADSWANASPCEGWTALDVVRHVTETTGMFLGLVGRPAPDLPSIDDDPLAAWVVSRDAMQAALDDPAIATLEYDGLFGRQTFEGSVSQFVCGDLIVHNWDLSRATGQDEQLDADEVRAMYEGILPMDEALRGPNAFGPKVDPPADADDQTKLLCFLGRTV